MSNAEGKLGKSILKATKWSTITELATRLVAPITNMILARILAPEAFGVVATVTMIITFADMFTDAGFQKYLVQHEFKDDDEKFKYTDVAFWTNLTISLLLWGIISIFSGNIANMVGNPGLGNVIIIACIQLPLTSFSSIQMALYRRDFNFKTLFYVKLIAVFIPFFITIPLAYIGFSYWSLIIGAIVTQFLNATILTVKSLWKPRWFFKIELLKNMFSFSVWSLIEAISIWFTMWIDAFIIGSALNAYYLGLYKTSTTLVNALMGLITASVVPVLFSALSRLQNDNERFNEMFFKAQKIVSIFVFPMGVGVYLYSTLATQIILGDKWIEAGPVIGIWALTSSMMIVFSHFSSEVYRAKGRPKLSFIAHLLHLVVLVPVCVISAKYGFWPLVYARSLIRLQGLLVGFVIMKFVIGIPMFNTIKNIFPTALSAVAMGVFGFLLQQIFTSLLWDIVSIILCSLFYFRLLFIFPSMRREIFGLFRKFKIECTASFT
jgi:O-antigen/teichoic acid export membrane protein